MMPTKATIAQKKYDSTHCRTYGLKLNNIIDADVIEKLASVPSMQGYIKQLIRDDISREKQNENIKISDNALEVIREKSEKSGKSMSDIVNIIVSDWIIRNV